MDKVVWSSDPDQSSRFSSPNRERGNDPGPSWMRHRRLTSRGCSVGPGLPGIIDYGEHSSRGTLSLPWMVPSVEQFRENACSWETLSSAIPTPDAHPGIRRW